MSEAAAGGARPVGSTVPASALGDGSMVRGRSPTEKLFAGLEFAEPSTVDDAVEEQGGLGSHNEDGESVEPEAPADLEAAEPEEADDDYLPEGKGTKENPLTVKDLPQDRFVEVKVDGKKEVVDLRDAVNGYVR